MYNSNLKTKTNAFLTSEGKEEKLGEEVSDI